VSAAGRGDERHPRILVVCDDDPSLSRRLARELRDEARGVDVAAVTAGLGETVAAVAEHLPDCLIVELPSAAARAGAAVAAIRRIRHVSPSTTVVVLSAAAREEDLYRALRAGASGVVRRDDPAAEIAAAVSAVLGGRLVIPAHLVRHFERDFDGTTSGRLSANEGQILTRIASGESNAQIAEHLRVTERTVRRHIENLYSKLHFADRVESWIQG
jgi:DNA-binding NarL/FixJ family response regulator